MLSLPVDTAVRLRGRTPAELPQAGEWAWHDLPGAWTKEPLTLAPGALTVWSWNGQHDAWATNTAAELTVSATPPQVTNQFAIEIANPQTWPSAVTSQGAETNPFPNSLILHVGSQRPPAKPAKPEAFNL